MSDRKRKPERWIMVSVVFLCIAAIPLFAHNHAHEPNKEGSMLVEPVSEARTEKLDEPLQVLLQGEGPELVLVGGGLTGASSWAPHVERLETSRTVASVQPLNVQYGLENRPLPDGYGVSMESAGLRLALDNLGWRAPVDVAAWSYGGLIALDFALKHPDRIRTLTLIEPPAMWVLDDRGAGDPDVEALRSLDIGDDVDASQLAAFLRAASLLPPGADPHSLPQWDHWMRYRRSLRMLDVPLTYAGTPDRLSALDRPVLLLVGTGSASYYHGIANRLASKLPLAHVMELPEGHAPHIVSIDQFMAELEDFQRARYAESPDGTRIGFVGRGSGPPVLFVHGTTADRRSWARVSTYLESDFTVYAMDRRGRGLSGDGAEYALAREAEDVAAVVDAIGEPVVLFGHSYGGLCALEAARLSGRVAHMILYEPSIPSGELTFPEEERERVEALVDRGDLESAMDAFLRVVIGADEALEAYRRSPLFRLRVPLAATLPRELDVEESYVFEPWDYTDLTVPTTLLLGGESPAMYGDAVETLSRTLTRSRVVVLPGQQHLAHHAAPELLADVLREAVK